ncbi:MAG: HEAT repeat domain-containing protein [Planctomycetes bacterium]|nr:HEAT repeat domain-containing protein [Planctomycetota bacterium]
MKAKALERWGSVELVPKWIEVSTSDRHFSVRRATLRALGEFPDARAVEPIGTLVTSNVGGQARATLKKIGPPAEPLAQSFLERDDWHWHVIGCELLVDVGTPASLEKLDTLQVEGQAAQVKATAAKAAKAIRDREAATAKQPRCRCYSRHLRRNARIPQPLQGLPRSVSKRAKPYHLFLLPSSLATLMCGAVQFTP